MTNKSRNWLIWLFASSIFFMMVAFELGDKSKELVEAVPSYQQMEGNQSTSYRFNLEYDDNQRMLKGNMIITYPNKSDTPLNELYFHVFPNAFNDWKWEEDTRPKTAGYMNVKKVLVNDAEVFPHQNQTLLKINLPQAMKPKEVVKVSMDFELIPPENGVRLSKTDHTLFLAQWYPMLAVYDKDGWHLDPYTTTGDPFFTEVANFHVNLKLPKEYTVVSSALEPSHQGKEYQLSQKNIRDFALMITDEYNKMSAEATNGIKVNLFYLNDQQEVSGLLLGTAVEAMDYFNKVFGPYPMKEIDIILAKAGHGIAGMEYPGLVTSDPVIATRDKTIPAYNVVAHELAHQWWYGVVGNDQIKEPWLDEGLTAYSEYLFMEQVLHREGVGQIMNNIKRYTDEVAKKNNLDVLQSIYNYGDYYGALVYGRPAAMLWDLRNNYGIDKVNEILKTYYQKYQYKIASTNDFIQVVNEVLEKDMTSFFDEWLLIK